MNALLDSIEVPQWLPAKIQKKIYFLFFSVTFGYLSTGTVLTVLAKLADETKAKGQDGQAVHFKHPVFQAFLMFLGEMACLIPYKFGLWRIVQSGGVITPGVHKGLAARWKFILPAFCDLVSSVILFIGLTLIPASTYQMLRGSVLLFTVMFSALLLRVRRPLPLTSEWLGLLTLMGGIVLVGVRATEDTTESDNLTVGCLAIIVAQLFSALHFVLQDWLLGKAHGEGGKTNEVPPLQQIGWEGVWGTLMTAVLLVILKFVPDTEDFVNAFVMMSHDRALMISNIAMVVFCAFFNYFGACITKENGALIRSILDQCRMVTVWFVSIQIGWETFEKWQLVGFIVMTQGMFMYYGMIRVKGLEYRDDLTVTQVTQVLIPSDTVPMEYETIP